MLKRIKLEQITRNPTQPRQHFASNALEELASSISKNGLQQPITVRDTGGDPRYMIVMGERRFRAHQLLAETGDVSDILCIVKDMGDMDMHIHAIVENLQREDVSAIEEARAYRRALDEFGYSTEELADRLGISQPWRITQRLGLLNLTPDNQEYLRLGVIGFKQAVHMARLDAQGQSKFLELVKQGLANSTKECADIADAITTAAAQTNIDTTIADRVNAKANAKPFSEKISKISKAVADCFDESRVVVPAHMRIDDSQKIAEQIKLIKAHLTLIEKAVMSSAATSQVA